MPARTDASEAANVKRFGGAPRTPSVHSSLIGRGEATGTSMTTSHMCSVAPGVSKNPSEETTLKLGSGPRRTEKVCRSGDCTCRSLWGKSPINADRYGRSPTTAPRFTATNPNATVRCPGLESRRAGCEIKFRSALGCGGLPNMPARTSWGTSPKSDPARTW